MSVFSERLKSMRLNKEKTQVQMAKMLNVRRSTYGEYERGKILPPVSKIEILADYFDVSVDYLIGKTNLQKEIDISKYIKVALDFLQDKNQQLYCDGNLLTNESREFLESNLKNDLKTLRLLNKQK